jgi:hypothetical protein
MEGLKKFGKDMKVKRVVKGGQVLQESSIYQGFLQAFERCSNC